MEHFRNKLVRGKAIGAQKHFAHDFNKMMAILENIKGVGGIVIKKRRHRLAYHDIIRERNANGADTVGAHDRRRHGYLRELHVDALDGHGSESRQLPAARTPLYCQARMCPEVPSIHLHSFFKVIPDFLRHRRLLPLKLLDIFFATRFADLALGLPLPRR